MRFTFSATLVSSLMLIACGGGGSSSSPDAKVISTADAPAGTPDAAAATCTVSTANYGDKGALTGAAYFDAGMAAGDATDDVLEFDAPLEGAAPSDVVVVQLYAGYGVFAAGAITAGTYQLTGEELNFKTCGACVFLATNATSTGHDDDYFATGGTLTVTSVAGAVGETFAGTLTNVTFQHVTIDPQTSETTPVGDSCTTGITNGTFTGATAAPPA